MIITRDVLLFLAGLGLVAYETVWGAATPSLLLIGCGLMGLPAVYADEPSKRAWIEHTPPLLLTPLDKAWLAHHEYLSSEDA